MEMDAHAAVLQTATSSVTNVIENKITTKYPLLDRRATQRQRLDRVVVGGGTGSCAYLAIAGGRGWNANYTIDERST